MLFEEQKSIEVKPSRAAPDDPQHKRSTCKKAHTGEASGAFPQIFHISAMIGQA